MKLTNNQLSEIKILITSMSSTILESVEGVAKVSKAIQTYLSCEFSEAVNILNENLEECLMF